MKKNKVQIPTDDLLNDLTNPDYKVRRNAARDLGRKRDLQSVEPLIQALQDKTVNVRTRAATALGRLGDPKAVMPLLKARYDKNCKVQKAAYEALLKVGEAGVDELCRALKNEDSFIRYQAVTMLANIGNPKATEYLIPLLKDEVNRIRFQTTTALGWLKDIRATQPLLDVFKNQNEEKSIRLNALFNLGEIGDHRVISVLLETLDVADNDEKRVLVTTLGFFKDSQVANTLVELVEKEPNDEVRSSAVEALGRTGDKKALPILLKALKEDLKYDRNIVINALVLLSDLEIEKVNNWLEQAAINSVSYRILINSFVNYTKTQREMKAAGKKTRWLT